MPLVQRLLNLTAVVLAALAAAGFAPRSAAAQQSSPVELVGPANGAEVLSETLKSGQATFDVRAPGATGEFPVVIEISRSTETLSDGRLYGSYHPNGDQLLRSTSKQVTPGVFRWTEPKSGEYGWEPGTYYWQARAFLCTTHTDQFFPYSTSQDCDWQLTPVRSFTVQREFKARLVTYGRLTSTGGVHVSVGCTRACRATVTGRAFNATTGTRAAALDFRRVVNTNPQMRVLTVKLTRRQQRRFARAGRVRYAITVNAAGAQGVTAAAARTVTVRSYRKPKPTPPPDPDVKRAEAAVEHEAEFVYGDRYFARADCRVRIRSRYFTCDVTIYPRGAEGLSRSGHARVYKDGGRFTPIISIN
jgi:hypothetical protein